MNRIWVALATLAMMMGLGSSAANAHNGWPHRGWQCVTYAASHSHIALRGNAHTWWDHAEGVYARGHQPVLGSVMVMKSSGHMPMGHVAIVSGIVSDREVLLTHANWHGDGRIETNVRAVDVSPMGDWSQVRVWYAPAHGMGIKSFPTYGFILPGKSGESPTIADITPPAPTQLAIADTRP